MSVFALNMRNALRAGFSSVPSISSGAGYVVNELSWLADLIPLRKRLYSVRGMVRGIGNEDLKQDDSVQVGRDDAAHAACEVYLIDARGMVLRALSSTGFLFAPPPLNWGRVMREVADLSHEVTFIVGLDDLGRSVRLQVFRMPKEISSRAFARNHLIVWARQHEAARLEKEQKLLREREQAVAEVRQVING
jgi:hypothetical protein